MFLSSLTALSLCVIVGFKYQDPQVYL